MDIFFGRKRHFYAFINSSLPIPQTQRFDSGKGSHGKRGRRNKDRIAPHRDCIVLSSRPLSLQLRYVQYFDEAGKSFSRFDFPLFTLASGCRNPHKRARPRHCTFAGWAWNKSPVDSPGLPRPNCVYSWAARNGPCDLACSNRAGWAPSVWHRVREEDCKSPWVRPFCWALRPRRYRSCHSCHYRSSPWL